MFFMMKKIALLLLSFWPTFLWASTPLTTTSPDWLIALGRFHPLVLHLPIGFFTALLIFEVLSLFKNISDFNKAIHVLLPLTALSATLASLLGWFLSWDGFSEDSVFWHQAFGLAFTVCCWVLFFIKSRFKRNPNRGDFQEVYLITLLMATITMGLAGHEGGNLTHGENYLYEKLPPTVKSWFVTATEPAEVNAESDTFKATIWPIFESRCLGCHGPKKQKGDYRLDQKEFAFAGGESGEVAIVPGHAMASYLVQLITLSEDNDEVMPPAKKKPLSPEEIVQIMHWVNSGAPWPDNATHL